MSQTLRSRVSGVAKECPAGAETRQIPLSRVGEGRSRERDGVRVGPFHEEHRRW
jgi:hypothetical protein